MGALNTLSRPKEKEIVHVAKCAFLRERQRVTEDKTGTEREGTSVSLTRKICWVTQLRVPLLGETDTNVFQNGPCCEVPKGKD